MPPLRHPYQYEAVAGLDLAAELKRRYFASARNDCYAPNSLITFLRTAMLIVPKIQMRNLQLV
jgi:hypothetical protein